MGNIFLYETFLLFYSYLKHSTGSSDAAFLEGNIPKNSPAETEKVNPSKTDHKGIAKGRFVSLEIVNEIKNPVIIPIIPPVKEIVIDSNKNCKRISLFLHL